MPDVPAWPRCRASSWRSGAVSATRRWRSPSRFSRAIARRGQDGSAGHRRPRSGAAGLCELLRFGIRADNSGGRRWPEARRRRFCASCSMRRSDPAIRWRCFALIKHPLLPSVAPRKWAEAAASAVELVALRGGTGRPDAADLVLQLSKRGLGASAPRPPPALLAATASPSGDLDGGPHFLARLRRRWRRCWRCAVGRASPLP